MRTFNRQEVVRLLIRTGAVGQAQSDRPAPTLLHSSTDLRVVMFHLKPGQAVPPHTSRSTVLLIVLSGRGTLQAGDEFSEAGPGDLVVVEPMQLHGMAAGSEPMSVLAAIAPCP